LPTFSTGASAVDVITLIVGDASTVPEVYVAGLNMGVPA